GAGEIDPARLATREIADAPLGMDAEAVEQRLRPVPERLGFVGLPDRAERGLERAQAAVQQGLLGQVGDRAAGVSPARAGVQLDQAGQRLEQGGLARAVAADQTDPVAVPDRRGEPFEQRHRAQPNRGIAQGEEGWGHELGRSMVLGRGSRPRPALYQPAPLVETVPPAPWRAAADQMVATVTP